MKILQSLPRLISSPPSSRKWQKINKGRRGISRSLSPSFVQNFSPFREWGKKLLSAHLFLPLAPFFATMLLYFMGAICDCHPSCNYILLYAKYVVPRGRYSTMRFVLVGFLTGSLSPHPKNGIRHFIDKVLYFRPSKRQI